MDNLIGKTLDGLYTVRELIICIYDSLFALTE